MNDVKDLLNAACDVLRAPEYVNDLPALARAVGIYPVERMERLAASADFPAKGPEGWSTRAVREWIEARPRAAPR